MAKRRTDRFYTARPELTLGVAKYEPALLKATEGPFARELLGFVCGEFLGGGITRNVYRFAPDDAWVVKIELAGEPHFQNVTEFRTWRIVQNTRFACWFAPCGHISQCGRILLQRYAEPIAAVRLPKILPSFFTDLKPSNWGVYRKHPVAVDYGKTELIEQGLTSRERKAHWT